MLMFASDAISFCYLKRHRVSATTRSRPSTAMASR